MREACDVAGVVEDAPDGQIPRSDCQRHSSQCLETRLQGMPGNVHGTSRCKSCYDYSYGQGEWPNEIRSMGKNRDCRWWNDGKKQCDVPTW